jgi:hypothetical protein
VASDGTAAMHPRLAEEWSELIELCPTAKHALDPERVEVVMELEAGMYSRPSTRIAVPIPTGYRSAGPDGFFVQGELTFADGSPLPVSDGAGLGMPGWLLVSFHHTDAAGASTWSPTADYRVGDNLIGYLSSIEHFLAHRCN